MAKIVYTLGTVKGSIAGLTFQGNRSGYIVRRRPQVHKSSTQKQTLAHSKLQHWLYEWQQLTSSQQMAWNTFALAHPKPNKFGELKSLTGANFFMSCNYMTDLTGVGLITDPPVYALPDAAPTFTLIATVDALKINYTSSFDYTDQSLIIWATPPTTRNTATINQLRKFVLINNSDPSNPQDITSAWESAMGITWNPHTQFPSANIFISLQPVGELSGITGALLVNSISTRGL